MPIFDWMYAATADAPAPDWLLFYRALDTLKERQGLAAEAALQALVAFLEGRDADRLSEYNECFGAAEVQQLQRFYAEQRKRLAERLPEALRPLAQALASLTQELRHALPLRRAANPQAGELRLALGAGAELGLEIQGYAPETAREVFGQAVSAGDCLLRLGVDGRLEVEAKASQPLRWGKLGVASAVGTEANLDLLYIRRADEALASALADCLPHYAAPGDLDAALAACHAPDGPCRILLDLQGTLDTGLELNLGRHFEHRYRKSLAKQAEDIVVSASAGLTAKARIALAGRYLLSVSPGANRSLELALTRKRQDSEALSWRLGVDLAVEGLAELADSVLQARLPDAGTLLALLAEYRQPGDKLVQELRRHGDFPALKAALRDVLLGALPRAEAEQQLAEYALAALGRRLDEYGGFWGRKDEDVASELIERLVQRYELAPTSRQLLEDKCRPVLVACSARVRDGLRQSLQRISVAAAGELDVLLAPLAAVGQSVSSLKSRLNGDLGPIVAEVEALLRGYQDKRGELVAELRKLAELQLGAGLSRSSLREAEDTTVFRARLHGSTELSRAVYGRLWTGRLEGLPALLDAAEAEGSLSLSEHSLLSELRESATLEFDVHLPFFQAGWSSVSLHKLGFKADRASGVLFCRDEQELRESARFLGESHAAKLMTCLGVGRQLDPASLPAPLSLSYSYAEKDMDAQDAREYFDSVAVAGIAAPGIAERALGRLRLDGARALGRAREAEVLTSLVLTAPEWGTLLAADATRVFALAVEVQFELLPLKVYYPTIRALLDGIVAEAGGSVALCHRFQGKSREQIAGRLFPEAARSTRLPAGPRTVVSLIESIARFAGRFSEAIALLQEQRQLLLQLAADPGGVVQKPEAFKALGLVDGQLAQAWHGCLAAFDLAFTEHGQHDGMAFGSAALFRCLAELAGAPLPRAVLHQISVPAAGGPEEYLLH